MRRLVACLFVAGLFTATVSAQLFLNPIGKAGVGAFEVGGAAGFSSIGYDGGVDVNRMMAGGYGAFGLNEFLDVYGSLAYSFSSELDAAVDIDGSGFLLSGGARGKVYTYQQFTAHAYGFLQYWSESFDHGTDASGFEIGGGALVSYPVMPELSVYGGLEFIPISIGNVDSDYAYYGYHEVDVDRDGMFTLRGGAVYVWQNISFRGELALGSEVALMAGASIGL